MDPIVILNLLFCIVIVILGIWGYKKKENRIPLYLSIAFGLFGITHLTTILSLAKVLENILIVLRSLGYLTVIFALYEYLRH